MARCRALVGVDPVTHEPELALTLYVLCLELKDFRGPVSATFVDLCDEAIALHRRLLPTNPASGPQLGTLLGWRGFAEYRRGDHQRAAALLRAVARRLSDEHFTSQLAMIIGLLAYALSGTGDHRAAIGAAREAVFFRRELGRQPDADGELSSALHTLCHVLRDAGRGREALGPAEESVAAARRHVAAHPGPDAERLLANGLDLQVAALTDHERWEEALPLAAESVRLYGRVHRQGRHDGSTGYAMARLNHDLGLTRTAGSLVGKVNARLQPRSRGLRRVFGRFGRG